MPRRSAGLEPITALTYIPDDGLYIGTTNGLILNVQGDYVHWLGGGAGSHEIRDGPIEEAGFVKIAALSHEKGRLWIAEPSVIRVLEAGVVRTEAGHPVEQSVIDGSSDVARFKDLRNLLPEGEQLLIGDDAYIRSYDLEQRTVTTIAGNGEWPARDVLPPQGPALAVPVIAIDMAMTSDGLLFSMGHQLGLLSDGIVTTVARSVWTDVPGKATDGQVGTAIFSVGDFDIQGGRLYFVHFGDYLRLLEDGRVSSLSSRESGRQEDGPLSEFEFAKARTMTSDPAGNLYIGDGCTVWKVQLN